MSDTTGSLEETSGSDGVESRQNDDVINLAELATETFGSSPALAPLPLVRLGRDPVDIRLFTSDARPVDIHWLKDAGQWFVLRCNGERCVLCMGRNRRQRNALLPVLDAEAQEVALLPVPMDERADSLLHELKPHLGGEGGRKLLEVSRLENRRYSVTPLDGAESLDLGDDAIRGFIGRLDGMTSAAITEYYQLSYKQIANQDILRDFPRLRARVLNRHPGLDLDTL